MKNELVHIRKNDVFTNSWIIAENVGRDHASITYNIKKFLERFKKMGPIYSSATQINEKGRPAEIFDLNEAQAIFLMTLMDNSEIVLDFKMQLAQAFVVMRKLILEKQTADWQQARAIGKSTRKFETDAIRDKLIPLAIEQGSTNYNKFYMTYSKLVNSVLKINSDMRETLPYHYVTTIDMLERIIENIISAEVEKGTNYKEIYQVCKAKCRIASELSFLPKLELLA